MSEEVLAARGWREGNAAESRSNHGAENGTLQLLLITWLQTSSPAKERATFAKYLLPKCQNEKEPPTATSYNFLCPAVPNCSHSSHRKNQGSTKPRGGFLGSCGQMWGGSTKSAVLVEAGQLIFIGTS